MTRVRPDLQKVAYSQNVFHFGLNRQKKKMSNPEHLLFRWIVLRTMIWHLFWEIWAKVKTFLRLSHLYSTNRSKIDLACYFDGLSKMWNYGPKNAFWERSSSHCFARDVSHGCRRPNRQQYVHWTVNVWFSELVKTGLNAVMGRATCTVHARFLLISADFIRERIECIKAKN